MCREALSFGVYTLCRPGRMRRGVSFGMYKASSVRSLSLVSRGRDIVVALEYRVIGVSDQSGVAGRLLGIGIILGPTVVLLQLQF